MELDKIKEKRKELTGKFEELQSAKQNLKIITEDLHTLRGAILLCNEMIDAEEPPEDNEPKPLFPEKEVVVNDLDKEEDNG
jgi:hypothetical protein